MLLSRPYISGIFVGAILLCLTGNHAFSQNALKSVNPPGKGVGDPIVLGAHGESGREHDGLHAQSRQTERSAPLHKPQLPQRKGSDVARQLQDRAFQTQKLNIGAARTFLPAQGVQTIAAVKETGKTPAPQTQKSEAAAPVQDLPSSSAASSQGEKGGGEFEKSDLPKEKNGLMGDIDQMAANPVEIARSYCSNIGQVAGDARIAWQASRLRDLENQLNQKTIELAKRIEEAKSLLAKRDDILSRAEENVVAIYAKMKPESAAAQIAAMSEDAASAILSKLTPRNAGSILNEMPPEKAARLANGIAMKRMAPRDERNAS